MVIGKQDILERARSSGLSPEVVEKDYVLGWLLAGVAQSAVRATWIFKGGTCLKKCFFETYRFSEDLDFTLLPAAAYTPEDVAAALREIATITSAASGIELPGAGIRVDPRVNKQGQPTYQARIAFRGPLRRPQLANVLVDLTAHEPLQAEADERSILHPYPDQLPAGRVLTYCMEELLAEKTRALIERTRPRDLYDVTQIIENHGAELDLASARDLFERKCRYKALAPPGAHAILELVTSSAELRADWEQMLAHQLPLLPPLASLIERLAGVLRWLGPPADRSPDARPRIAAPADARILLPHEANAAAAALDPIWFAGANRLLVAFDYHGRSRLAEPYSLRRAAAGHVTLFAWEQGGDRIKQFRVDEMVGLRATGEVFAPRFAIELTGAIQPSRARVKTAPRSSALASRSRGGPSYVYRCWVCGRAFRHRTRNAELHAHKTPDGYPCHGRRGQFEPGW